MYLPTLGRVGYNFIICTQLINLGDNLINSRTYLVMLVDLILITMMSIID